MEKLSYYRLKTTDQGGTFTYRKIVAITAPSHTAVFPNPAKDQLFVRMPTGTTATALQNIDAKGMRVKTLRPVRGLAAAEIKTAGLPAGVYSILLFTGQGNETQPFEKQ